MSITAQFYVTVNGGANQSDGVDVTSSAVIAFVPLSTVGWLRQRWEITDYPEGWATPSGWTLRADGVIYSTDVTPTSITMPEADVTWGKWMLRLMVNEQLDTDAEDLPGLIDENQALCLPSPSGLRDLGAREGAHFTTTTTRGKQWARDYQRNLRAIETPGITLTTSSAGTTRIRRYAVADGTARSLRAVLRCYNVGGTKHGEYEVKGFYKRVAGTLAAVYAAVVTTNFETDAGLNVTVTLNGNTDVDVNVVGLVGETMTWKMSELFL